MNLTQHEGKPRRALRPIVIADFTWVWGGARGERPFLGARLLIVRHVRVEPGLLPVQTRAPRRHDRAAPRLRTRVVTLTHPRPLVVHVVFRYGAQDVRRRYQRCH